MYQIFAMTVLALAFSLAEAQTQAPGQVRFGSRDSRGACQEVRIKSFPVTVDYFDSHIQADLRRKTEDQIKYKIWPDSDPNINSWGRSVELNFQDGELRTRNPDSKNYRHLDTTKPFAIVFATLAFNNLAQAKKGVYQLDGIVTLVTGSFSSGPFANGPLPGFRQSAVMGYMMSGAYRRDGGPFNEFGNGKNDRGRIISIGLESTDSQPMTVDLLKQTMGELVQVVYP